MLPDAIQFKIRALTDNTSLNLLARARECLSSHYREERASKKVLKALKSDAERMAYLLTRLPATYAAIQKVLSFAEIEEPSSVLDVGAGPGTALLAIKEKFPALSQATLMERDAGFVDLGRELLRVYPEMQANWCVQDVKDARFESHDLVIASYSLGELERDVRLKVLEALFAAARQTLIVVEPGTPFAFEQMKEMRQWLLSLDGNLVAPCPHSHLCPLEKGDWCHFSARVERSREHRKMKGGALGYEDEKFCYWVFSKKYHEHCHARIIRHPLQGKGFIKMRLCSQGGIVEKTLSKKNKEEFLKAKKLKWGDTV